MVDVDSLVKDAHNSNDDDPWILIVMQQGQTGCYLISHNHVDVQSGLSYNHSYMIASPYRCVRKHDYGLYIGFRVLEP